MDNQDTLETKVEEAKADRNAQVEDPAQEHKVNDDSNDSNDSKEYGLKSEDYYDMDEIVARISERKRAAIEKKKKERLKLRIIAGAILAFIVCFILSFTSIFTVDEIAVEGNSFFTAEEIINMGHAAPGKNLIYHPDKKSIVDYLEANPYIKKAKVSRRLPSTLVITVEERKQVAAIKYADEYLIIDREGYLLRKTKNTPKITILEGVVIRKMTVGETIKVKDEDILDKQMNIIDLMNKNDLYFVRIKIDGRMVYASIYDSLVCRGTYKQLQDGIETDKLHRVLEKLFDDGVKRGTITFSDEGYVSFEPVVY